MYEASTRLRRARSAYGYWAPVVRAAFLRNNGENTRALEQLATIPHAALPARYYHLRARIAWMEGVAQDALGRFDLGRVLLTRAMNDYRTAREVSNLAAVYSLLAEVEWFLGNVPGAWMYLLNVSDSSSAKTCLSPLHTSRLQALLRRKRDFQRPRSSFRPHTCRARRAHEAAPRHLCIALVRTCISAISDRPRRTWIARRRVLPSCRMRRCRARNTADIEISRSELYSHSDCSPECRAC